MHLTVVLFPFHYMLHEDIKFPSVLKTLSPTSNLVLYYKDSTEGLCQLIHSKGGPVLVTSR